MNPGALPYSHPLVLGMLILSIVLFVLSGFVNRIRAGLQGPVKQISRSWKPTMIVFGLLGVFLAVSRAEAVTFLSMPFLPLLWVILIVVIIVLHALVYRKRSYTILPTERVIDPREKYLPKRKR